MSRGAPLAGPSPLVPPQPRPKGYHSLDHSIDPYSVPAGRLLAGQKSVVLQCRNCGSLGEHLPSGPRVQVGARCTCPCVKVTERVLYLCHHAGHPPCHPRSCSRDETRERETESRETQRVRERALCACVTISKQNILFQTPRCNTPLNDTLPSTHAPDVHSLRTAHTRP